MYNLLLPSFWISTCTVWWRSEWNETCRVHANTQFCQPVLDCLFSEHFALLQNVHICSVDHPNSFSIGSRVLSPGVEWPGSEVDHSLLPSSKVKNAWRDTSTPPIRFHGVNREFTFLLSSNRNRINCSSSEWSPLFCLMLTLKCMIEYGRQLQDYNQSSNDSHTSVSWHAVRIKCRNRKV
jgi:hypothetical protein